MENREKERKEIQRQEVELIKEVCVSSAFCILQFQNTCIWSCYVGFYSKNTLCFTVFGIHKQKPQQKQQK
jgi:hypothetical protein